MAKSLCVTSVLDWRGLLWRCSSYPVLWTHLLRWKGSGHAYKQSSTKYLSVRYLLAMTETSEVRPSGPSIFISGRGQVSNPLVTVECLSVSFGYPPRLYGFPFLQRLNCIFSPFFWKKIKPVWIFTPALKSLFQFPRPFWCGLCGTLGFGPWIQALPVCVVADVMLTENLGLLLFLFC